MKQKKSISLVLAAVLLLTLSFPAAAIEPALREKILPHETMDVQGVLDMATLSIADASTGAAEFKLNGTNFSNLTLGDQIPMYQETEDGFVPGEGYPFPVLENGKIISILYAFYEDNMVVGSQFSVDYAPQLQAFLEKYNVSEFALVNTDQYLIAVSETAQEILQVYYGYLDVSRHRIAPIDTSIFTLESIAPLSPIEHTQEEQPSVRSDDGPGGFGLNVPAVTQFQNGIAYNTCWAASVISICQYKTGKDAGFTPYTLCSKTGVNPELSGTLDNAKWAVTHYQNQLVNMGYNVSLTGNPVKAVPTQSTISSIINSQKTPIYANFFGSGNIGHTVVFKAYSGSGAQATIRYMDPYGGVYRNLVTSSNSYGIMHQGKSMTMTQYMTVS